VDTVTYLHWILAHFHELQFTVKIKYYRNNVGIQKFISPIPAAKHQTHNIIKSKAKQSKEVFL